MKNNKGFTLIEFIAIIAIMAVITLIAIPAYGSIREMVLQKQYENLVSLIETTAAKYVSQKEKDKTIVTVQELIDDGLLETDDGTYICDPRDKSKTLNCYVVAIEYNKGNYTGTFIEKEYKNDKGKCDFTYVEKKNEKVKIIAKNSSEEIVDLSEWIKEDVTLSVEFVDETTETIESWKWTSDSGATSNEDEIQTVTKEGHIKDTTYNVTVTTDKGNIYFANERVRIDKQDPLLVELQIDYGQINDLKRKITVRGNDQKGSGIYGYYVGEKACLDTVDSDYEISNDLKYTADIDIRDADGKYIAYNICTIDNVGNIGGYEKNPIKINLHETTPPECTWSGESTTWTNSPRTITIGCKDEEGGSGCHENYDEYSETFSETTKTSYMKYEIRDNAGNVTKCAKEANVYVDTTPPVIESIINPSAAGKVSEAISLIIEGSDKESGVDHFEYSSDNSSWTKYEDGTEEGTKENGIYVSKVYTTKLYNGDYDESIYIRVCDVAGNCSDSKETKLQIGIPPTIEFKPNGNSLWNKKEANTTVTVAGDNKNNDDIKSINYRWFTPNNTVLAASSTENEFNANSDCGYNNASGECYLYVEACDINGNCSSKTSESFNIDRKPPTITKTSKSNASCKTTYCNSSTLCCEFTISDDHTLAKDIVLYRSHCNATSTTSAHNNCKWHTAKERLNYYSTNNKYLENDEKTIKQKGLNATFGLCTTFNDRHTVQYAFMLYDQALNDTEIIEFECSNS